MPSAWVARQIQEDYGVDLEVEIFEGGVTTGLTFRVQLKGTDKPPRRGKISRSVKARTRAYWQRLDVPVLVALYSTSTETFYARWAHSLDTYGLKPDAATRTYAFSTDNILKRLRLGPSRWVVLPLVTARLVEC
jgi:hypothetical protein